MSRRPDVPSAGVLVAGAVAVVAVVGFVLVLSVGGTATETPGARVRIVRAGGPAGMAVLAGRCRDQRVTSIELATAGGSPVWRIDSRKGSIERRYVVGAPPPLGFREVVGLGVRPTGTVRARVVFDREGEVTTDRRVVDIAALPPEGDALAHPTPGCGGHVGLGDAAPVFAVAAALVVAGYLVMLVRAARS